VCFNNTNRPQTVIALLERMKKENVVPNTIVLTAAIDSLAREGGGTHTGTEEYSTVQSCTVLCYDDFSMKN
jgi:pentatricopeptide repeat protein